MIAPNKYINTKNSILGQSSVILALRKSSTTVSSLWDEVRAKEEDISYERFILCLDFLYTVGIVSLDRGTLSWRH
ncbi:ABC-three component system middle component 6 [Streptomyces sp. NPDC059015]|uniref:ABC-three component system middle component 6 n=1 Tax=unclassified Streptomyces TaxID=2593676 RepID=UPI00368FD348